MSNLIILCAMLVSIISFIKALDNYLKDNSNLTLIILILTIFAMLYCIRNYVLVIAK